MQRQRGLERLRCNALIDREHWCACILDDTYNKWSALMGLCCVTEHCATNLDTNSYDQVVAHPANSQAPGQRQESLRPSVGVHML